MSHIVLSEQASNPPAWKQLDELAMKAAVKEHRRHATSSTIKSNIAAFSSRIPPSSFGSNNDNKTTATFDMQDIEDALFDILDMAEQVVSSDETTNEDNPKEQQQEEESPSANSKDKVYGFETDSTWDDFCDDLPLE